MKIDEQVCSLELAKRLKELGVKQHSLFSWQVGINLTPTLNLSFMGEINATDYSAFTVAELGELLPWRIKIKEKEYFIAMDVDRHIYYQEWHLNDEMHCELDDTETEADARAKMLIYLIENKLMEVPR